jgi:hypothetical protein
MILPLRCGLGGREGMGASGSSLNRISPVYAVLIATLLTLPVATPTRAAESRTYAVSWFAPATNSQVGDCPDGINIPWAEQQLKDLADLGYTPQQIADLVRKDSDRKHGDESVIDDIIAHRGRLNGQPVDPLTYPATVVDPKLHYLKGKYAYGFNLDGRGAASPDSFEDPETHELGVNNQLYRALGCLNVFRGTLDNPPTYYFYIFGQIKDSQPVWLITLGGDDLSKDGDVTVTFDRALEHMRYNIDGTPRTDETYRIDPDPRSHNVFSGHIKDGVITLSDPGASSIYMLENQLYMNEFRMSKVHMRLTTKADGTLVCMMGGYQPWADLYWAFMSSGAESTEGQSLDQDGVGIYYLFKKLADAGPDAKTGNNTLISATYYIKAVPAFTVPAPAAHSVRMVGQNVNLGSDDGARNPSFVTPHSQPPAVEHSVVAYVPAEVQSHRLSNSQYRHIITDVFGPDIELGGRFEPGLRVDGLLEVGLGNVSVSTAGMEQYDTMARKIAAQVVDEQHRGMLVPCEPQSAGAPDDACVARAMRKFGLLLYRRPLTDAELASYVGAARVATGMTKDFYSGLSLSLAAMLSSPKFLFQPEVAVSDPDHPGGYRLDSYSLASRLSAFLWDAAPDLPLLASAERGELSTRSGYDRQVDRMLSSPRLETGVRSFFSDMFQFDDFSTLTKDGAIYPKFDVQVAADAQEETLRTVVDLLLVQHGDYRDVFTTKKTFLTSELAAIYRVPFANDMPNGSPDAWGPYVYPATDPRAGVLAQVSFTALHSPPGRASATIRGKALREIMLCEKVPSPPANVNFKIVLDTGNPLYKTARERLTAHRSNPVCAGCHKFVDPIGLSLENFDGSGAYRTRENNVLIDTSGELGGIKFDGPMGLGRALHDDPATVSCLVNRLASYALGRQLTKNDQPVVQELERGFAASGFRLPELMRQIVTSGSFYRVSKPQSAGPVQASLTLRPNQTASARAKGKVLQ